MYAFVHVCACVCARVHAYVCVRVRVFVCLCVRVCVLCVRVRMLFVRGIARLCWYIVYVLCLHVCVRACVYVCTLVYIGRGNVCTYNSEPAMITTLFW